MEKSTWKINAVIALLPQGRIFELTSFPSASLSCNNKLGEEHTYLILLLTLSLDFANKAK
jgi:hypothetical protein